MKGLSHTFTCNHFLPHPPPIHALTTLTLSRVAFSSVQFSSVAQSCPTLCDPMNHSTPGLPVHHQLPDAMIFVFWMLNFKPTFSLSTLTFIRRLFSSSSLAAIRVVSSAYLDCIRCNLITNLYALCKNSKLELQFFFECVKKSSI